MYMYVCMLFGHQHRHCLDLLDVCMEVFVCVRACVCVFAHVRMCFCVLLCVYVYVSVHRCLCTTHN